MKQLHWWLSWLLSPTTLGDVHECVPTSIWSWGRYTLSYRNKETNKQNVIVRISYSSFRRKHAVDLDVSGTRRPASNVLFTTLVDLQTTSDSSLPLDGRKMYAGFFPTVAFPNFVRSSSPSDQMKVLDTHSGQKIFFIVISFSGLSLMHIFFALFVRQNKFFFTLGVIELQNQMWCPLNVGFLYTVSHI